MKKTNPVHVDTLYTPALYMHSILQREHSVYVFRYKV